MSDSLIQFRFGQRTFFVEGPADDKSVTKIVRDCGCYEEWLWNIVIPLLKSEDICIDVGANIGLSTLILASHCSSGYVFAFEPHPLLRGFAEGNLARNSIQNASIMTYGLGASARSASLMVQELGDGYDYGGGLVAEGDLTNDHCEMVGVQLIQLDAWVTQQGLDHIDFLKIDVEGSELEVLRGALSTIKRFRPKVAIEFFPEKLRLYGERSDHILVNKLFDTFPYVYHVDRLTGGATRIRSYAQLRAQMMTGHGVEDLLCLWRQLRPPEDYEWVNFSSYEASHVVTLGSTLQSMFLSHFRDGWMSQRQFAAAIFNNGASLVSLELRLLESACRNHVRVWVDNCFKELEVHEGPCGDRTEVKCSPGLTVVYVETSAARKAAEYFGNEDPRMISVRLALMSGPG